MFKYYPTFSNLNNWPQNWLQKLHINSPTRFLYLLNPTEDRRGAEIYTSVQFTITDLLSMTLAGGRTPHCLEKTMHGKNIRGNRDLEEVCYNNLKNLSFKILTAIVEYCWLIISVNNIYQGKADNLWYFQKIWKWTSPDWNQSLHNWR